MNKWHANKQDEYVKITDIFINCSLVVKHEHFDIRIFEFLRKICGKYVHVNQVMNLHLVHNTPYSSHFCLKKEQL